MTKTAKYAAQDYANRFNTISTMAEAIDVADYIAEKVSIEYDVDHNEAYAYIKQFIIDTFGIKA